MTPPPATAKATSRGASQSRAPRFAGIRSCTVLLVRGLRRLPAVPPGTASFKTRCCSECCTPPPHSGASSSCHPRGRGRMATSGSPRRSAHHSSPARSCGGSSCPRIAWASAASTCTRCGTPRPAPARRRHAHQGRPGTPRPLVPCHHRVHLQPRRSRPAARGRGPARPGAAVMTVAVLRPRCCIRCSTNARGGPPDSGDPPLTSGSAVGLTGFEPATP
jgi:hypothetical protein